MQPPEVRWSGNWGSYYNRDRNRSMKDNRYSLPDALSYEFKNVLFLNPYTFMSVIQLRKKFTLVPSNLFLIVYTDCITEPGSKRTVFFYTDIWETANLICVP
jgi:hypothetical protein